MFVLSSRYQRKEMTDKFRNYSSDITSLRLVLARASVLANMMRNVQSKPWYFI